MNNRIANDHSVIRLFGYSVIAEARQGFTMIEMLLATMLVGVLTTLSILTFQAVTHGWQASTDYLDKVQRTDYALNQLIIALRSSYWPDESGGSSGKSEETKKGGGQKGGENRNQYGFYDPYKREGNRPSDSDIIEWTKKGSALVGSENAMADSVHRVRVMILEEGDTEDGDDDKFETFRFREPIKKTGLYARAFVDPGLASTSEEKDSREYYPPPTLVADGVVGFRCRTLKEPPSKTNDKSGKKGGYEKDSDAIQDIFEDAGFPYAVELTLFIEKRDDDFFSQKEKSTIVRVVKIPIYEHSQGGSTGGTK